QFAHPQRFGHDRRRHRARWDDLRGDRRRRLYCAGRSRAGCEEDRRGTPRPRQSAGVKLNRAAADKENAAAKRDGTFFGPAVGAYANCVTSAFLRRLRRTATPAAPKPSSIIAQVAGSGTPGVGSTAKICAFDEPLPSVSVRMLVFVEPRSISQNAVTSGTILPSITESGVAPKCAPRMTRPVRLRLPKSSVAEPLRL